MDHACSCLLLDCHGLNLKQGSLGQRRGLHAGAGRRFAGEILGVDGVDGGKVAHVRQKHRGLHHIPKAHSGGAEHGPQVFQRLGGLGLHALGQLAGSGNQPQLAGGVQGIARQLGVAVGPHGGGGVCGGDRLVHRGVLLNCPSCARHSARRRCPPCCR